MSSVLRPIIINNPRESIYITNSRAREEIERKIEEYETIINPISENYEQSDSQSNIVNNSVVNNESRNNDYSQYQDVINPLIINRRSRNSQNNREDSPVLETESSTETSYELFESTEEDGTSDTDDNEDHSVVNTSSNNSLVECEKEFNEALKKFLEESLESNESDTDCQCCAICLNKISDIMRDGDVHIEYDECGHKVHIDCMKKWRQHRELSTNFKKMRLLKCELCQTRRSFTIVKSLVEVKKSNRMRKICCIV
tara:strand:- start:5632 stop:6399 length:768 start_codon:yes stop_codon:yes gene_type:complete